MREVLKEDTKLTVRVTQMYLLQGLVRRKLATEDVKSIELKQRDQRRILKFKDLQLMEMLMKRKLMDAVAEAKSQRKIYFAKKAELYGEINGRRSHVAKEFRKILNKHIQKVFEDKNNKNKEKII